MNIYYLASNKNKTISGTPRYVWEKADKELTLKKCWLSLQESISEEDRIFLIDDNLPEKTSQWIIDTACSLITHVKVPKTKEKYQFLITALETLQTNIDDRSHFILEDDYLFVYDGLDVVRTCLQHWHSFGVPDDNPNKYTVPYEAFVYVGNDRHWRSINTSSGWSVYGNSQVWKSYINLLKESAKTNNYNVFKDTILQQASGICPLPGVATHLKEGHMSPLIDWTNRWKEISI